MRRGTMSSVRREAFASSPAFVRHWRVDQRSQRPTTVAAGSLHVSCPALLAQHPVLVAAGGVAAAAGVAVMALVAVAAWLQVWPGGLTRGGALA